MWFKENIKDNKQKKWTDQQENIDSVVNINREKGHRILRTMAELSNQMITLKSTSQTDTCV